MTGRQTSTTRGSRAAFTAISGPMPEGSPTVTATIGSVTSEGNRDPVRDDLRAGVAVERGLRLVRRAVAGDDARADRRRRRTSAAPLPDRALTTALAAAGGHRTEIAQERSDDRQTIGRAPRDRAAPSRASRAPPPPSAGRRRGLWPPRRAQTRPRGRRRANPSGRRARGRRCRPRPPPAGAPAAHRVRAARSGRARHRSRPADRTAAGGSATGWSAAAYPDTR